MSARGDVAAERIRSLEPAGRASVLWGLLGGLEQLDEQAHADVWACLERALADVEQYQVRRPGSSSQAGLATLHGGR